jgi:hypothetical protein
MLAISYHKGGLTMPNPYIGISSRSSTELFRNHGITPFRNILSPDFFHSIAVRKMRKSAVLIPEVVFWLMATVALSDGAMAAAVISFWAPLRSLFPRMALQTVSEEAFCTARKLLPLSFFRNVFLEVVSRYLRLFGQRYLWRGLHLWGIDGTRICLPRSGPLFAKYGTFSNKHGSSAHPQALLVGLVGLWTGLCRNFLLVPVKRGEQICARFLIRLLGSKDLLICDRAFCSYRIFVSVLSQGAQFLIRVQSNRALLKIKRIFTPSTRCDEWFINLPIPSSLLKQFPLFPKSLHLRVIQYQIHGFRAAWLVTSLCDTAEYPYDELVRLYHERWNHETVHREWKRTLQISNLRSKSPRGILKEVFVQLTLNNTVRWIMTEAAGESRRPMELQFLKSKRLILAAVAPMTTAPVEWLSFMYKHLLKEVARSVIVVRPGRSYPRRQRKGFYEGRARDPIRKSHC